MPDITTALDLTNTNRILTENGISYAIADSDLKIVKTSANFRIDDSSDSDRLSLLDLAPELIGIEDELAAILTGVSARYQLPLVNRISEDGTIAYANFTVLPHFAATGPEIDTNGVTKGTIDGLIFVIADVTDFARIEQEVTQHRNELSLLRDQLARKNMRLAAANAELRKLDDLKSSFVSTAAHELRSPLSTVSGYLDLLTDEEFGTLDTEQLTYTAAIRRSTVRLLETIEKLLDLTRISAGRMDIVLSMHDMEDILHLTLNEVKPLADAKDQQLMLTLGSEDLPILCDKNRTTQVLHNLLANAIKYTPEGGNIELTAKRAKRTGFVQISVIDEGIGIPASDQHHIFDTFFRASNVHQASAKGSGLGLNIARSLVELHGGDIWFESEVGIGSRFHVTFPTTDT